MNATPTICPLCGELVIAWISADDCTLVVPPHPDQVWPWTDCLASARAMRDGKILQS